MGICKILLFGLLISLFRYDILYRYRVRNVIDYFILVFLVYVFSYLLLNIYVESDLVFLWRMYKNDEFRGLELVMLVIVLGVVVDLVRIGL